MFFNSDRYSRVTGTPFKSKFNKQVEKEGVRDLKFVIEVVVVVVVVALPLNVHVLTIMYRVVYYFSKL